MEEQLNELSFSRAFMISVGVAVFYYFTIFTTKDPNAQIAAYKEEIAQYEGEIKKFDKQIAETAELKDKVKVLEKELDVKHSYVSKQITKGDILQKLSVEARKSGLNIETVGEDIKWARLSSLEFLDVRLSLSGDFTQVMLFLSNLTREKQLYVTNKFELTADEISNNEEDQGKPRVVNLAISIRVFRKIPGSTDFDPNAVVGEENV